MTRALEKVATRVRAVTPGDIAVLFTVGEDTTL